VGERRRPRLAPRLRRSGRDACGPIADRYPRPSVGVITSTDQAPSIVAKALLDTIEDLNIAATLDDAADARALAARVPRT
jgi:hypothetical protein